jgi:predicted transcriptional regulator
MAQQGHSQNQIAKKLGVSSTAVGDWLRKWRQAPLETSAEVSPDATQADLALVARQILDAQAELERVVEPKVRNELRKTLVSLVVQQAKLRPPVPKDPEQDREMVRAAAQAREKLERLIRAALEGRLVPR